MTYKEAIKYLRQLYPNGGHWWLDEQRIEAIGMAVKALQEEPVSRTSNDIEAAMQEVKEKSKTFTEANKGKSSEQILAEMRGEEPVSDLEEEIEKCIESLIPETELNSTTPFALEYVVELLQKAFKSGAKWQKEQIIKDAVDGAMGFVSIHLKKPNFGEKFKEGDKVKVIVIKED